MEDNKYYTPEIEEFHIGFEYEFKGSIMWHKFCYKGIDFINEHGKDELISEIKLGNIRVKYLDKEDIESLGWNLTRHSVVKEYSEDKTKFRFKPIEGLIEYSFNGRFLLSTEDNFKTIAIRSLGGLMFIGVIKNKSELVKLMNQLGIECKKD